MSYNANPIQAPPGGFNFAGGASNPAPSALHTNPSSSAQESPAAPPNTAHSKFREEGSGFPTQSDSSQPERGIYSPISSPLPLPPCPSPSPIPNHTKANPPQSPQWT